MEHLRAHKTGEQGVESSERDEFLASLKLKTDEELDELINVVSLGIEDLRRTGSNREELAKKIIERCRLYNERNSYERRSLDS